MAIYLGSNKVDGATANTTVVDLTQAEYDALTTEEKNNGTVYCVSDASGTYLTASEVSYGSYGETSVQSALDNIGNGLFNYMTTTVLITGHNNAMRFRKSGRVVSVYLGGNWTNLPHGVLTTVGTIPSGCSPQNTVYIPECTFVGHDVTMMLYPDGNIFAYNYRSTDITSNLNGVYNFTYVI